MTGTLYKIIIDLFHSVNYTSVAIITALESTFLPFPSEFHMTTVGIQSAKGMMNPAAGLLAGLLGVWVGTTINYAIGYFIGDAFIERFGKYFFIKKKHYHHAQELFRSDANFYTFFGRLLPGVRHLISIPAGMIRMPYLRFISLSLLGSAIWLSILIVLGYSIKNNDVFLKEYIGYITTTCFMLFLAGLLGKHVYKRHIKTKSAKS